jgi:cell division protein ZapE
MPISSGDGIVGVGRVVARYRSQVAAGDISEDQAQLDLARRLDRLDAALGEERLAAKGRALGWLFATRSREPLRGFYIHGRVGSGKTMLMDEFFDAAALDAKRRAHFHQFMADVDDRIHAHRVAARNGAKGPDDPIGPVARQIAGETRLLCLDEFAVEDIADAMILSRLFTALFEQGLVLVATSNTAPGNLYRDGLNRPLFLPFVDVLKRHVEVVELNTETDYRLAKLGEATAYVTPAGPQARAALDKVWRSLVGRERGRAVRLPVKGREVGVPLAAKGVARIPFADLCEAPLGTNDFAAIAEAFDTVIVDDIPVIARQRRDVARRFINLIDVFYDRGVKLVASAAAEPAELYPATEGNEAFAFRRTISRLSEMRSGAYLSAPRAGRRGAGEVIPTG